MNICQIADSVYGSLYGDIRPNQHYSSTSLVRNKSSLDCSLCAQTRAWVTNMQNSEPGVLFSVKRIGIRVPHA